MTTLKDELQGIIGGIMDPETGLMVKFNCKFMRKELVLVEVALC